ncbi:MAG: hypothetical protein JWM81_168 [Candidatus Saccharibacteria bacterium]|nr:hypothetical protein [Candidatus Saccharibacteria bacterium]
MSQEIPKFDPAAANLAQGVETDPIVAKLQALLEAPAIEGMHPEEQGAMIADRFIGAVVASDEMVNGAGEAVPPMQILGLIDSAAKAAFANPAQGNEIWTTGVKAVTRTNGMRQAAQLLSQDSRTGSVLDSLSRRVKQEEDGKLTLTSLPQLQGYLETKYAKSSRSESGWVEGILAEIEDHATTTIANPYGRWQTRDNLGSDVKLVRENQQHWENNASNARASGVDMDLVRRSAEYMREQAERSQPIGHAMLEGAGVVQPNYDHLFQP